MGLAWGQATNPALGHLVRPTPGTRPLGAVLAELSRQGRLPLSYSSSLVPVAHPCTLRPGPPRPLGAVLREVLAAEHLSYGLLAGQLVLWPDRVAPPAGVVAVNGRATPPAQSASLPPLGGRSNAEDEPAVTAKAASPGQRAASPPDPLPGLRAPVLPSPARVNPLARTKSAAASGKSTPQRAASGRTAIVSQARPRVSLPSHSTPAARHSRARPGRAALAALASGGRRVPSGGRSSRASRGVAVSAALPRHRPGPGRGALALLPPRPSFPPSGLTSDGASPRLPAPVDLTPGPGPLADAGEKLHALAGLLRRAYLHGEAWGSESLPLNAAAKLGLPRLYLVLGAAAGPFDHQSGWAWGVGLGTTGRAQGRFTPSLDLLQWFLASPGDEEAAQGRLTQLRPALAWQLKRGGRWQLVGGPTLNLATAHRGDTRTRWTLGQDQWLWLDSAEQESLLRLWPGVQLGVRF